MQECTRVIWCDFLTDFSLNEGKQLNRFCFPKNILFRGGKKNRGSMHYVSLFFQNWHFGNAIVIFHRVHYMTLELFSNHSSLSFNNFLFVSHFYVFGSFPELSCHLAHNMWEIQPSLNCPNTVLKMEGIYVKYM